MFSPESLNTILKQVLSRLNGQNMGNDGSGGSSTGTVSGCGIEMNSIDGKKINITPSQALVIGGILGGVLTVDSVLVDKNQTVQIVLSGSLKQKTQLEKVMDQIGAMPFDDVLKAMLGRLT